MESNFAKMSKPCSISCCVLNCSDKFQPRHRFPVNHPEICKKWIEATGNPKVQAFVNDLESVYKKYFVCQRHFKNDDIVPLEFSVRPNILKKRVVPSLHLPGK